MSANNLSRLQSVSPKAVYDITPFSSLDYPEHLSAIVWFAGCNMRCSYCYNEDIVLSKGKYNVDEVLGFLKKRVGLLEAVVLSGGEATLFSGLAAFCSQIKALGFKIKLDTNGTHPQMIKQLLDEGLLDYIALDYKAPEYKYYAITKHKHFAYFKASLALICASGIGFEVRTTLHNDLLDEEDINAIIHDLKTLGYTQTYYIQAFVKDVQTIGKLSNPVRGFDESLLCSDVNIVLR